MKNTFIKSTVSALVFLFMAAAVFSVPVFAKTNDDTQAIPGVVEENNKSLSSQKGGHVLEWAVFAVAAAEVAGLMGMGLSSVRKEQRKAKAKLAKVPVQNSTDLPLPYEKYSKLKSVAVKNR